MRGLISQQSLRYGTDLDVTNFVNGQRVTLNPAPNAAGEAATVDPDFVFDSFAEGCSLRMPCPQKYR